MPSTLSTREQGEIFVLITLPYAAWVLLFSDGWFGERIFKALHGQISVAYAAVGASLMLALALYLTDVSYWEKRFAPLRRFLIGMVVFGLVIGMVFGTKKFPAGPMCVFAMGVPFYLEFLNHRIFASCETSDFLLTTSRSLQVCSLASVCTWIVWIERGNHWTDRRLKYTYTYQHPVPAHGNSSIATNQTAHKLCVAAVDKLHDDVLGCTAGYLLWAAPLILGVVGFICSMVGHSLVPFVQHTHEESGDQSDTKNAGDGGANGGAVGKSKGGVMMMVRLTVFCFAFCAMGMWVAASFNSISDLSTTVLTINAFGIMFLAGTITSVVSRNETWRKIFKDIKLLQHGASFNETNVLSNSAAAKKIRNIAGSTGAIGLGILFVWPVVIGYILLSAINQFLRSDVCPCIIDREELEGCDDQKAQKAGQEQAPTKNPPQKKRDWVTAICRQQLKWMGDWNWTHVLVWAIGWAVAIFVINVAGAKGATVFFSWLNTQLLSVQYGTVVCIFAGVGIAMFLCPVIPGVPVYITGGILLTESGKNAGLSYEISLLVCTLVCWGIKLMAVFMQQVLIGEQMGQLVSVRKTCCVNSSMVKGFKLILEEPGMTVAKVSVLVGGPDWPISVMTGILRLNRIQMLIGTLPVYLLIAPTCCAGAFLAKGDISPWNTLLTVALGVTALVQGGALLGCTYFVGVYQSIRKDEIAQMENDREVQTLEEEEKALIDARNEVTKWTRTPCWVRVVLVLGFACMTIATYGFMVFSGACFKKFDLGPKYSIATTLNGDPLQIILPAGWVSLGLWLGGYFCYKIYHCWAAKAAMAELRKVKVKQTEKSTEISKTQEKGRHPGDIDV